MNPVEIEEAVSALALEPFDRAEFPFQFLRAFGNKDTAIARLRAGNTNQSDVPGAVLQRSNIHIAACAPGAVDDTLAALRASPKTASQKAKFILATDGEAFQAEDMNGGGTIACSYAEFPDHFGFFLPLAGITTVEQIRESSFDIKATGRLNKLYIELLKDNPDWASRSADMNHFMARLSICPPTGTGVKVRAHDLFETPVDQAEIDFENEGGETYICGNPPYAGSQWRSPSQQADMDHIFSPHTKSYKDLDYVACWFMKAAEYGLSSPVWVAFVATKSVNQGRQVAMLWPLVFSRGFEIFFAHRPFDWKNLAANNAGVTVVIVGMSTERGREKFIYDMESRRLANNINAYLLDAQSIIVNQSSKPINGLPTMDYGNKPSDGGFLILSEDEKSRLVADYSESEPLLRKLIGSREFTSSSRRWCLWIDDEDLELASRIPPVAERIEAVRRTRMNSTGSQSRDKAAAAHRFVYTPHKENNALVVPSITTDSRYYLPVGIVQSDTIVSNKAAVIYDPPLWTLAIVASRIHEQWIGNVCVRMRMGYSYSNTLGWNTFPIPTLTDQNKADLTRCAEDILLAREAHFPATIADLYDPEAMPEDLRAAHERNDEVLERIYIGRRFRNDTERLEKLFELYTKMTGGKSAKGKAA